MNNTFNAFSSLEKCPALVLNADYRPLSYYPLSLWSWQDTVKSVFLERVIIVSNYDRVVRSPSFNMKLPSVIALKDYIVPQSKPSFTRFNVFLRDKFSCQYCGSGEELTFDHLLPRSKGGETHWDNVYKYLISTGRRQDPPDETRWYYDVPSAERIKQEGDPVPFDELLRAGALEDAKWNRENADYINFDPNKDSIAHKELEELEQAKRDQNMEDGMLGS